MRSKDDAEVELTAATTVEGAVGPDQATAATSEAASNRDSDHSKKKKGKGAKREPSISKEKAKKAKSQDANSTAMSTLSSRRLQ